MFTFCRKKHQVPTYETNKKFYYCALRGGLLNPEEEVNRMDSTGDDQSHVRDEIRVNRGNRTIDSSINLTGYGQSHVGDPNQGVCAVDPSNIICDHRSLSEESASSTPSSKFKIKVCGYTGYSNA